jgi:hypothetical protein
LLVLKFLSDFFLNYKKSKLKNMSEVVYQDLSNIGRFLVCASE